MRKCARGGRGGGRALPVSLLVIGAGVAVLLLLRPSGSGNDTAAPLHAANAKPVVARLSALAPTAPSYTVLGSNDLGMHCYQSSYKGFMVLPPANTLKVQVFKRGAEGATLVRSGINISYQMANNTYSAGKTDFWDYASNYFGWNLLPNEGITGNYLTGTMVLSTDTNYWVAEYIPVTPYTDDMKWNPYQQAKIKVTDSTTGRTLATQTFVIPVSDEMRCDYCHGSDIATSILQSHDADNGTTLYTDYQAGKPHACAECHKDNILGAPGLPGVLPLSQAMHGFHADKMKPVVGKLETLCYACHPGPKTRCLRGTMYANGKTCTDSMCHGTMKHVADTQAQGREAWLQEPKCGDCHGNLYAENTATLYRNSYLANGPENMNGFIMCESCHNSPHAEWTSMRAGDNALPLRVQGMASFIRKCTVCHQQETGVIHGNGG